MDNKDMGTILKELRQQKGLTQKDIAKSLIITPQTISKWENGLSQPSLEMLIALSEIYGVSVDELLKGSVAFNDVSVIKEKGNVLFQAVFYSLLLLMIGFGVLSLFFDVSVLWITKVQIDHNSFMDVYPAIYIKDSDIGLLLAVIMIASPVFIGFLGLLDKRKYTSLIFSNLVLMYMISEVTRYMGHPEFHQPQLALYFVFGFILFLVTAIVIQIEISSSDIKEKLLENNTYLIFGVMSYIIAIILPFTYSYVQYYDDFIDAFTYYESIDQYIVVCMMIVGTLVLLKSYNEFRKIATVASLGIIFILFWTTIVYIFNSGLIIPSVLMYGYIMLLGLTFSLTDFTVFKIKESPINWLTVLELISLGFFLYLITLDGDLFSYYDESMGDVIIIRNNNLPYGSLIALHMILLLFPMFFRFIKLEKISYVFYVIWFGFEIWFVNDLFNRYIFKEYRVTDGMFYFVPPILLGLYWIIVLLINLVKRILNREKREKELLG